MLLICKNNITQVFDDGENYRVKTEGEEDRLISKKDEPQYPLACCLKWNMIPVDIEYLNRLSDKLTQKEH